MLSYRSSDEEGNLALPSPFIADVAELLEPDWAERRRRRLLADVVWPPGEAPTARELAPRRGGGAARRWPASSPVPVRSLSPTALRHVRHSEILSGGALEAYGDCPVKWLVERELQPERIAPEPDPLARGSHMHERARAADRARWAGRHAGVAARRAARSSTSVLAESAPRIAAGAARRRPGGGAARDRGRPAALPGARGRDGDEWEPQALELRFGFDGEEGSLPALELGDGPDRCGSGARSTASTSTPAETRAIVRDYKSGSVAARTTRARGGAPSGGCRSRCTCSRCAS